MEETKAMAAQVPELVQVLVGTDRTGKWATHSLELLSDARQVARRWNGMVGAWALGSKQSDPVDCSELAACGCRRLRHLIHERFDGWSSETVAAALLAQRSADCRLILLPGTACGEEVAAILSEKLEAVWIADVLTFAVTRAGVLEVTAVLPGGRLSRNHRPVAERIVVATMRAGVAEIRRENPEPIEVATAKVDLSKTPVLTEVKEFLPADPQTIDIAFAARIVAAGRGSGGPAGVQLIAKLADSLKASLGASRMAVDLGWAPPERQVGQTGRTVRPELYVACGISGASHHLAGMRDSRHIVTINPDRTAPIHEVAHLSLPGDLHQVIPEIIALLERRTQETKG